MTKNCNCPKCGEEMVSAQATNFGEPYQYCRACKKELTELERELAEATPTFLRKASDDELKPKDTGEDLEVRDSPPHDGCVCDACNRARGVAASYVSTLSQNDRDVADALQAAKDGLIPSNPRAISDFVQQRRKAIRQSVNPNPPRPGDPRCPSCGAQNRPCFCRPIGAHPSIGAPYGLDGYGSGSTKIRRWSSAIPQLQTLPKLENGVIKLPSGYELVSFSHPGPDGAPERLDVSGLTPDPVEPRQSKATREFLKAYGMSSDRLKEKVAAELAKSGVTLDPVYIERISQAFEEHYAEVMGIWERLK